MTLKDWDDKIARVMRKEEDLYRRFMEAADGHPITAQPGELVVYIEDDPDQVSLLKTVLARYSTLKLLSAFNAEDGKRLIQLKHARIKCVVLDLSLESGAATDIVTGLNLLQWVQISYPGLPIVVLTAHNELIEKVKEEYPDIEVLAKTSGMESIAPVIQRSVKGTA